MSQHRNFRLVFRVDSSAEIGLGHLMRCLALSAYLQECGAECHFIVRDHLGHGAALAVKQGVRVWMLPKQADSASKPDSLSDSRNVPDWLGASWESDAEETSIVLAQIGHVDFLVVDHYSIDIKWESRLRSSCGRIIVIDDLANRSHNCDVLIDQNLGRDESDYSVLVPSKCQVLVGPQYALLRPQFSKFRTRSLARRNPFQLKRLLVSLGGTDSGNVTGEVLAFLKLHETALSFEVIVVLGRGAPWVEEVREFAGTLSMNATVLTDVADMAGLIAECDAAIGAAGSSVWERCCLGIPTLMVVVASNQVEAAAALVKRNVVRCANDVKELPLKLRDFIDECTYSPDVLQQLSVTSATITDGLGCGRVAKEIGVQIIPGISCLEP